MKTFQWKPGEPRARSKRGRHALTTVMLGAIILTAATALAQNTTIEGNVTDAKGSMIPKATVTARNEKTGKATVIDADAQGHFSFSALPDGLYDIEAVSDGFSLTVKQAVHSGASLTLQLAIAQSTTDITVDADQTHSIAAALAPMDALLNETSARTEITQSFINNFTSPVSDYGEDVAMAPGTVTTNGNGVGLGQSKTVFRGFPDGEYDIDFDGIPFYDTNSPTHHSWAFFPSQFLGGIDFDRSPGTASTIGPTPFGGSIHLLSKPFDPISDVRASFASGSFNTFLYDAEYDSGGFGPGNRLNTMIDVHHLQSHGYQSLNNQQRDAGDIQFAYKLSDRTTLTGFSAVIWLNANTPNFAATRCQMYGVSPANAYSCALAGTPSGLYPETGAGINFLLTNNSDPLLYLDTAYNNYHVPTDFEYVGLHSEFGKGWVFDIKPYTYNYDNSEKYSNAVPITDNASLIGTTYAPLGAKITTLCNQQVTKKGVTAEPCGVDKYNSYRKYGETSEISKVSKFGTFNAGMWYEWADTNRHQYPSDPLNHWADQALPNFAEKFWTDSYQPFAEFQFKLKNFTITPGIKFAYYTIATQQYADDGKTVGCITIGCSPANPATYNPNTFITNGGSYFAALPSGSISYRIKSNWSAYFQGATGSVVPPSSVFDYAQPTTPGATFAPVAQLPRQQKNTTYQGGTIFKLKYATFDADYFHVYFDNSYSCVLNTTSGDDTVCFLQPPSVTQGFEAESNISFTHGLGAYLNVNYTRATYIGSENICPGGATVCASSSELSVPVPGGLWVQQTPSDIETEGVTYQHHAWDAALFNKRVGQQYYDNGSYHNQYTVTPYQQTNAFVNYTLRTGGRFDNTKFRLSFNNLFNQHSITGITLANGANTIPLASNAAYTDPFNTNGQTTISGQDNVSILSARSIMLSVTVGLRPKGR